MNKPSGPRLTDPTSTSILLGGVWVNASAIAREQGMSQSMVSKILSGKRGALLSTLRKISNSVGMGLEELIDAIELRKEAIKARERQTVAAYKQRVANEDYIDEHLTKSGQIAPPRIPAYRLPDDVTR